MKRKTKQTPAKNDLAVRETNVINAAMAYWKAPDRDGDGRRLVTLMTACARLDARRTAEKDILALVKRGKLPETR